MRKIILGVIILVGLFLGSGESAKAQVNCNKWKCDENCGDRGCFQKCYCEADPSIKGDCGPGEYVCNNPVTRIGACCAIGGGVVSCFLPGTEVATPTDKQSDKQSGGQATKKIEDINKVDKTL